MKQWKIDYSIVKTCSNTVGANTYEEAKKHVMENWQYNVSFRQSQKEKKEHCAITNCEEIFDNPLT